MPVSQYVGVIMEKSLRRKPYLTVHGHELPIMESLHKCPIKIVKLIKQGRPLDPADEWARLETKYGMIDENKSYVADVYRNISELADAISGRFGPESLSPEAYALQAQEAEAPKQAKILSPLVDLEDVTGDQEPGNLDRIFDEQPPVIASEPLDAQMLRDTLSDWGVKPDNRWGDQRLRDEVRGRALNKLGELAPETIESTEALDHYSSMELRELIDIVESVEDQIEVANS